MPEVSVEMFHLFARYNRWMNEKLYSVASKLSEEELKESKGAFFGSVFQTLNHLMFGDHFLITRIRDYFDESTPLDGLELQWEFEPTKIYCSTLDDLTTLRTSVDTSLIEFTNILTEPMLKKSQYPKPDVEYPLWVILLHLFNHQTHHRGQITTLVSQAELEIGITDINMHFIEMQNINNK